LKIPEQPVSAGDGFPIPSAGTDSKPYSPHAANNIIIMGGRRELRANRQQPTAIFIQITIFCRLFYRKY